MRVFSIGIYVLLGLVKIMIRFASTVVVMLTYIAHLTAHFRDTLTNPYNSVN
jgi:hypothetical protein